MIMKKAVQRRAATVGSDQMVDRARFSRWRAGTLILVHVLIAGHILHWLICGRTLAPLEFNEVMHTLELGIITAGFLFMSTTMLATLIFGRFFCSWGCHVLALQDLCAWGLARLGIRPKAIRSRTLLWVPAVVAGYMFVWPQLTRLWAGRPAPLMHVRTDQAGWASFVTENFWRNLPGPGVAMLTFGVVGFLIVYVLGSRSFCAYGCPYGAVFGLLDRLAPGRIRLKRGHSCDQCGVCTAVCKSHVRVHEEIARYGMIVDSACEKDLDCIAACPNRALGYAFGAPALLKSIRTDVPVRRTYDFSWAEEGLLLMVFAACLVVLRGLYDRVPFFLSIGAGSIAAYGVVILLRLFAWPDVSCVRRRLKQGGQLTASGIVFVAGMTVFALFMAHSAVIRLNAWRGRQIVNGLHASSAADMTRIDRAIRHLRISARWGLLPVDRNDYLLAQLYRRRSRPDQAEATLRQLLARNSEHFEARMELGDLLQQAGRHAEAIAEYERAVAAAPSSPHGRYQLAGALFAAGRPQEAIAQLRESLRNHPDFAAAHYELGALLVREGESEAGIAHLRRAIALDPGHADAHYNLSVALAMNGALAEAGREIELALELNPDDAQSQAFRQHLDRIQSGRAP